MAEGGALNSGAITTFALRATCPYHRVCESTSNPGSTKEISGMQFRMEADHIHTRMVCCHALHSQKKSAVSIGILPMILLVLLLLIMLWVLLCEQGQCGNRGMWPVHSFTQFQTVSHSFTHLQRVAYSFTQYLAMTQMFRVQSQKRNQSVSVGVQMNENQVQGEMAQDL